MLTLQSEAAIPSHDPTHMSELSIEYSSALEREKELSRRYEELFTFLRAHVKDSQVCVCVYVCVYMCVYTYVCMYVCTYVYMCVYIRMCICMYLVCMYVCFVFVYYTYVHISSEVCY